MVKLARSPIQLRMRADKDKMGQLVIDRVIQYSKISGNTDTSKTVVLPLQRMILKHRIERILEK